MEDERLDALLATLRANDSVRDVDEGRGQRVQNRCHRELHQGRLRLNPSQGHRRAAAAGLWSQWARAWEGAVEPAVIGAVVGGNLLWAALVLREMFG